MKRNGFTLVELLVVIAIIAILVVMLLPGPRGGSACSVHEQLQADRHRAAQPPFGQRDVSVRHAVVRDMANPDCANVDRPKPFYGVGWSTLILPYMEDGKLHDDLGDAYIWSGPAIDLGEQKIQAYVCPSDPQDELINVGSNGSVDFDRWKTNAGGVADSVSAWKAGQLLQQPIRDGDGMLLNVDPVRIRDVDDGTSKTLFVGEVTGGEPGFNLDDDTCPYNEDGPHDVDGWVWVHGPLFTTAPGINGPNTIPGDRTYDRCLSDEVGNSSYHPDGALFLQVDGAVRFLLQDIDPVSLAALTTRDGGDAVSADADL